MHHRNFRFQGKWVSCIFQTTAGQSSGSWGHATFCSTSPGPGPSSREGLPEPPNQPTPLTFRDCRGQRGLAVVHMANGAHVHMRLVAHVGLLGLHGQAAAQAGQCGGHQRPQQTLQQWGRAGAKTCRGRSLESGRQRTLRTNPASVPWRNPLPRPSPLRRGVARSKAVAAIVVVLAPGVPGPRRPRVQKGKGTGDWRSLPAEVKAGRASLGLSSLQFLWPSLRLPGVGPKATPGKCWSFAGGEGGRWFPQRSRASRTDGDNAGVWRRRGPTWRVRSRPSAPGAHGSCSSQRERAVFALVLGTG